MRACVQRVRRAAVEVEGRNVAQIQLGLVVLLGVAAGDQEQDAEYLARKIVELRVFEDQQGKMNLGLREVQGEMLVVSQFTLLGDCRKGRRPSFVDAAPPDVAQRLYHRFVEQVRLLDVCVATGIFQAMMTVSLDNQGPVTMLLDSSRLI